MTRKKPPPDPSPTLTLLRLLDRDNEGAPAGALLLPGPSFTRDDLRAFFDLVKRVDRDHPADRDLLDLDRALTAHPGLWRLLGDLASRSIDAMIGQLNPSVTVRLSLRRGADELLASIAGAAASPLESALAEQIAVCWVRLRIFEMRLSNASAELDPVNVRFWEDRVAAAQRRYLFACESLARIRRLAARTPQLFQINVAGQQINIARPAPEEEE
jgi:hypothetical protein